MIQLSPNREAEVVADLAEMDQITSKEHVGQCFFQLGLVWGKFGPSSGQVLVSWAKFPWWGKFEWVWKIKWRQLTNYPVDWITGRLLSIVTKAQSSTAYRS